MAEPVEVDPVKASRWPRTDLLRRLAVVPRDRPAGTGGGVGDEAASELLASLRSVDVSLARLLQRVLENETPFVVVSPVAIAGWRARVPEAWMRVERWLQGHGVAIVEV